MDITLTRDEIVRLRGHDVLSSEGEKIGTVENVYLDVETDRPEWVTVGTGTFGRDVALPLREARVENDAILVPFTKAQIKDAPEFHPDAVSHAQERDLYSYYGLREPEMTATERRYRRYEW